MLKFRAAAVLIALAFISGCSSASGNKPVAATSAVPALGSLSAAASAAPALPSAVASPTAPAPGPPRPVLIAFTDNSMVGGGTAVTMYRTDGTVVATLSGRGLADQHTIGAYVVTAGDDSLNEWTIDASGVVKPVAPAAAQLLAQVGHPLIVDATSAMLGCSPDSNGDCTAKEVNLTTGAVRPLLTVPATLNVLDISYDLRTVWFREVTSAGASGGSVPAVKLDVVAVDLGTGAATRHNLPAALADEPDLAISRDGRWVAGQESAGINANNIAIRHLHLVSLATGVDSDVQGSAPSTGGSRSPSIQFSPDGATVAWWGGLSTSSYEFRINVAPVGGTGKTMAANGTPLYSNLARVFWLDGNRLAAQNIPPGSIVSIDTTSGVIEAMRWLSYLEAVLY